MIIDEETNENNEKLEAETIIDKAESIISKLDKSLKNQQEIISLLKKIKSK
ncbi:hypothetical protein Barb6_02484 [Bacteroidales bacterium Barb6]|nr:hypothetical protein Barb6_02484 [Bacteroidales bacterium Barb6]